MAQITAGARRLRHQPFLERPRAAVGSRALVGAFLVAASAVGLFVAYNDAAAGPTERYVVARANVPAGTRLTAEHLEVVSMDLPSSVRAYRDASALVGATVVSPVEKGDLIQQSSVVFKKSGARDVEVSFKLSSDSAVGGTLRPGETVDVLVTYGTGSDAQTETVVSDAEILAVSEESGRLATANALIITLALNSRSDAADVATATKAGSVTLVRTSGAGR